MAAGKPATVSAMVGDDLSALVWVQEALRRSLELANRALRRHLRQQAQLAELDTVDPALLRQARSQLHQSVGALELVGLGRAAELLRAAEAALQNLSDRPRLITLAAVETIERGTFAVLDFIARRLAGKPVSTLALFPQYRALRELAGVARAHPADLWTVEWSWRELVAEADLPPRRLDEALVHRIEADLLVLMRGSSRSAAARLSTSFAGLASAARQLNAASETPAAHSRLASLWQLAAGFYEALAEGLLQPNAYSKRVGSRLLSQLRAGEHAEPSERLAHELLFFCSQAVSSEGAAAGPRLAAVWQGHGLADAPAVDYEQASLGRFDPAWLAQARKRLAAAKSHWSAAASGDVSRLAGLAESFGLVSDSLARLFVDGGWLGQALQLAAQDAVVSAAEPPPGLAMEVANALLFLEAAIDDADVDTVQAVASAGAERLHRLAERIDRARRGLDNAELEPWMAALYLRVSDRQTRASVVQALRAAVSEVESGMDLYFRDPTRRDLLDPVPAQLAAMHGVLSMLGLDQAAMAVLRMRDDVALLASAEQDRPSASGSFERLADNLGALDFLIGMVSAQPETAKSLFHFDPETGKLAAATVRQDPTTVSAGLDDPAVEHDAEARDAGGCERLSMPDLADPAIGPHDDLRKDLPEDRQADPEMREVFLDEARELLWAARQALDEWQAQPTAVAALGSLRRVFHTLKGSARMVGLDAFAQAAWACEQLFNGRLGESAVVSDPALLGFSLEACDCFDAWVQALAAGDASQFHAAALVAAAQALAPVLDPGLASDPDAATEVSAQAEQRSLQTQALPGLVSERRGLPSLLDRVPGLPLASDLDLGTSPLEPALLEATEALEAAGSGLPVASDAQAYRQIGALRIGLPLLNIYLGEADDLSRRLGLELAEWALAPDRPAGEVAIALAHSLAGNSGAVGFAELSRFARWLEQALERSQRRGHVRGDELGLFKQAAEEIRRLLQSFAAGFPDRVDELLLRALRALALGGPSAMPVAADLSRPSLRTVPGLDEDIDQVDALDAELFPLFAEEAQDLLPQLQSRLREWAGHPGDRDAASACMRSLHTLKGSARLAGAARLGEMAHRLETAVEALMAQAASAPAAELEALLSHADALAAAFDSLHLPAAALPATVAPTAAPAAPAASIAPAPWPAGAAAAIDWRRFLPQGGAAAPQPSVGVLSSGSVRVRTPLLDRLVNQAGEVSITRTRVETDVGQLKSGLGDFSDNLDRLRAQLRDIELQAETQIDSRLEAARAAALDFDPLEMDRYTRFQEIARMMAESVSDLATVQRGLQRTLQSTEDALAHQARMTRDMQDDLLRTRMVEFEGLSERLYRVVRQAAKETAKTVRLDIVGGAIEVDRGVLDRITPALEHLLRNCVAHGIESAELRLAAGKPAAGSITLAVTQVGNEVGVEVRDDGAGLDLAAIHARALALGLMAADAEPGEAELVQLIFQPGFSTAAVVTDLAGRGVGMDVVRTDVSAMGGRIETLSSSGQGTSVRLVLPLTTAVTQVVMLRCGERKLAVPSTLVEAVRRVPLAELARAYERGALDDGPQSLPFFWLDALLQGTPCGLRQAALAGGRNASLVVIRSAAQRVVLHVDEVLGNQEVVVKNLGPQLSRVPGLVGLTLLASGLPALIYNPVALAMLYGDAAREATRQALAQAGAGGLSGAEDNAAPLAPLVLVVHDSLTVRRVTQRLLEREGYRVALAKDGVQALAQLDAEWPALLLTDIEMPRMDGFDLVRTLRADSRVARLPVIMISSRIARKHRDYAAELGVDHYLGKPYAEDELLSLVARYTRPAAPS